MGAWHEGWACMWPANKDGQVCGSGVRDERACGLQMRVVGHGMRDGPVCGLQTRAAGHGMRVGWVRGLQMRVAGVMSQLQLRSPGATPDTQQQGLYTGDTLGMYLGVAVCA